MPLSKFLDPKNDYAFKRIFGTEKNRDILIHFINDILGLSGSAKIGDVVFLNPSHDPEIASKKQSLVDVLCTDAIGRQYIIEMQVASTAGFEKRAQYYAAKAYSRQLMQGDDYRQLKEIIFIAITDFIMFKDKENYYSTHCLLDTDSYCRDLKDFSFTFLELPKFNKHIDELSNLIEKWAYFFKNAGQTQECELPEIVGNDGVILRAYEELNRFSWTENELDTYEHQEKRERDARSILLQKSIEGEEKGLAKGLAKGLEQGIAQGIVQGIAQGFAQGLNEGEERGKIAERRHLIKLMLEKGMTDNDIMTIMQLTEAEFEQLK